MYIYMCTAELKVQKNTANKIRHNDISVYLRCLQNKPKNASQIRKKLNNYLLPKFVIALEIGRGSGVDSLNNLG